MTTSVVFQDGASTRSAARAYVEYTTTSADNTANECSITVAELGTVTQVFGVQITNSSNVRRLPQAGTTISGNVVTIVDSGLAADEVVTFVAVGYTA